MGYRGKLEEQERARELRAEGWTMPEIAEELGVARSSVSLWTRDVPYVPRRPRRGPLPGHRNKLRDQKLAEIEEMNRRGLERISELSDRDFLVAGIALYAGDGAKTGNRVGFSNSNPEMIRFFCDWLRRFFTVDESRLRIQLYLHEGLDLAAAERFWSDLTRIPTLQFGKPYRAVPDATIRHNKHEHGCCHVRYCCARTHREILGLMRALLASDAIPG
jgi:transcriptional regulator with XRE-family HTH domain